MAYELNPLKKQEEEALAAQQNGAAKTTQQLSTTSDLMTPGGTTAPTDTGTGQAPVAPTGGVDVTEQQKYQQANALKAQQLAQKTAGMISGDISGAEAALKAAGEQFKGEVGKSTVAMNQDLYNRATAALTDQQAPGYVAGAAEKFRTSPEAQAFKQQYGATYGGPSDIIGQDYYSKIIGRDVKKAQETAKLAETQEGRARLIARTAEDPYGRYSLGTQGLNESLLAGSPEALSMITGAAARAPSLATTQAAIEAEAKKAAESGRATTEATRKAYQENFVGAKEVKELEEKAAATKAKAQADYEAFLKDIETKYGTQEGIAATQYFDASRYQDINEKNVAQAEDYARLQALSELTGQDIGLLANRNLAGQASLYTDPSAQFRLKDFEGEVGKAKTQREKLKAEADAAEAARLEAIRIADENEKKQKEKSDAAGIGGAIGAGVGYYFGGPVGAGIGLVVGGAAGELVHEAGGAASNMAKDVAAGIGQAAPQLTTAIGNLPSAVGGAVSGGLQQAGGALSGAAQQIGGGISEGSKSLVKELPKVPGNIGKGIAIGAGGIGKSAGQLVGDVGKGLANAPGQIIKGGVGLVEGVGQAAGGLVKDVGSAGGQLVSNVGSAISNIGCFHEDTPFLMSDGLSKKIKDIIPGDVMAEGGEVTKISRYIFSGKTMYLYPAKERNYYIPVTGSHAVCEDGIWKRVEEASKAILHPYPTPQPDFVYNLINVNHKMICKGILFADEMEVDSEIEISLEESIDILNGRNK